VLVCTSKFYKSLENYNNEIEIKETNGRNLLSRPRVHEKEAIKCVIVRTQN
jgi:hypothetical protein